MNNKTHGMRHIKVEDQTGRRQGFVGNHDDGNDLHYIVLKRSGIDAFDALNSSFWRRWRLARKTREPLEACRGIFLKKGTQRQFGSEEEAPNANGT
jgi:hypothetical protein